MASGGTSGERAGGRIASGREGERIRLEGIRTPSGWIMVDRLLRRLLEISDLSDTDPNGGRT